MQASRPSTVEAAPGPKMRPDEPIRLQLSGELELWSGRAPVSLPPSVQRMVAYVALAHRPVARSQIAGALWELSTQTSAERSLRTALWRLNRCAPGLLVSHRDRLSLAPEVTVDVHELATLCEQTVRSRGATDAAAVGTLARGAELLPGWGDMWLVAERERLRLLRIQALEALASELAEERPEMGMLAAMSVVATEPLQESAWRLVVRIHIQQGNLSSAERSYSAYRCLLAAELGVEPSHMMEDLRESWCPRRS